MANVVGTSGNDTLFSTIGDDSVDAGAGNDVIIVQSAGVNGLDSISGGSGLDTIDFRGVNFDLLAVFDVGFNIIGGPGTDDIKVFDVEKVIGTHFHDNITGALLDDDIAGARGNDILSGVAGNDSLNGGQGRDTLNGGDGDDVLCGGLDRDTFVGGVGHDTISLGRDNFADFDQVLGFEHHVDRIDLRAIDANFGASGNQAFKFVGTNSFTAAGQLHVEFNAAMNGFLVKMNMDSDSLAEGNMFVDSLVQLDVGDFFL